MAVAFRVFDRCAGRFCGQHWAYGNPAENIQKHCIQIGSHRQPQNIFPLRDHHAHCHANCGLRLHLRANHHSDGRADGRIDKNRSKHSAQMARRHFLSR